MNYENRFKGRYRKSNFILVDNYGEINNRQIQTKFPSHDKVFADIFTGIIFQVNM